MIEFRRNKKTGILEAWKDGKKTGDVRTMGDDVTEKTVKKGGANERESDGQQHRSQKRDVR